MIGVNIDRKAGTMKDTVNNILARLEYVVHIADETLLPKLHENSRKGAFWSERRRIAAHRGRLANGTGEQEMSLGTGRPCWT